MGGQTRLYVGNLSRLVREEDLDYLFSKYGPIRDIRIKSDYAFVEMDHPRDAEEAVYYLDNKKVEGQRIIVEFSRSAPRGPGGRHGFRGPMASNDDDPSRCFNCGKPGHWARECPNGDWGERCWNCGEKGHTKRDCNNRSVSPRGSRPKKRFRSARSRSYTPPPHSRSGSYSPRSHSRSRSPLSRSSYSSRSSRSKSRSSFSSKPHSKSRSPTPVGTTLYPHSPSPRDARSRSRSASPALPPPKSPQKSPQKSPPSPSSS